MIVAIAADHGGFGLKADLIDRLQGLWSIVDLGANRFDPADDYPDFAFAVGRMVVSGKADRGILVCGSGAGACIAANKIKGVRSSVCHDTYSAHQGVEHDDMNVLCLGARVIGLELAMELVGAFLKSRFLAEERYERRIQKIKGVEGGSRACHGNGIINHARSGQA